LLKRLGVIAMEVEINSSEKVKEILEMAGYKEPKEDFDLQRVEISLPAPGKLISEFAKELSEVLKTKNTLFYRIASKDVIEVVRTQEKETGDEYLSFKEVSPERFVTHIETFINPIRARETQFGIYNKKASITPAVAKIVLKSEIVESSLPTIKRIFPVPIPIIYEDELTFPKKGYDSRFSSFTPFDSPEIRTDIPLQEAKEIINQIYGEFCFEDRQSFLNAIANLLTPFLRGLFPRFSTRTPIWLYMANRERAGKDYCADIVGIVYEGFALQEPPISSGEKSGNNNEELRKKILSALLCGRKRLHFANNKGYINNAVFEGVITSEKYSDRALGRNEILTFDNEIEFSLSGNIGIGFTPDLANRSLFVKLFLDIEDANAREFNNPNLHAWVRENRGLILSALYSLVKNWFDKGCPSGTTPFASFPDWARICGGIMESAGYESPCTRNQESLGLGGDSETRDMKILFEEMYKRKPEQWVLISEIKEVVESCEDIFSNLDFSQKSSQTIFGNKIKKFIGRVFSDITLKINKDINQRASRQEYMFSKKIVEKDKSKIFGNVGNIGNTQLPKKEDFEEKKEKEKKNFSQNGNLVNLGNLCNQHIKKVENNISIGNTLPMCPRLPKKEDFEGEKEKKEKNNSQEILNALKILENQTGKLIPIEKIKELNSFENLDESLTKLKEQGLIFSPRENFVQIL